jgi:signal transduction histidine kinase
MTAAEDRWVGRRLLWIVTLVAALPAGVVTALVVRADGTFAYLGPSGPAEVTTVVLGWTLIGAGLVRWRRDATAGFGALLAVSGFGWFVANWNSPVAGSPPVFTLGLVLWLVCPPLVAHAVLNFPRGRLADRVERVGVVAAYVGAVVVSGLVPALLSDPASAGCAQCPHDLLSVADRPDLADQVARAGMWLGLVWSCGLGVIMLRRLVRATPAARRVCAPTAIAGLVYLVFVAADFQRSLGRGFLGGAGTDPALAAGQAAGLGLVLLAVAWGWLRRQWIRRSAARLVADLATSPAPGRLREMLVETLGDETIQVGYPLTDGTVVDGHGRPFAVDAAGPATRLVQADVPIALLIHRPGLLDDLSVVDDVVRVSRLVLDYERLSADVAYHLAKLRSSRARIIAAGDDERCRLERNLHDGAQQRLVSLMLALRVARTAAGADDPQVAARLDDALTEIGRATEELRRVAHGIFPAVLAESGLADALAALAEEADVPIRVKALPDRRVPGPVESAGYLLVAEVVQRYRMRAAVIDASASEDRLRIMVEGPTAASEPATLDRADLEDRIGALDGRLVMDIREDGTLRICAEIPCAS